MDRNICTCMSLLYLLLWKSFFIIINSFMKIQANIFLIHTCHISVMFICLWTYDITQREPHLHLQPLCFHYTPHFTQSPPETWKTPLITKYCGFDLWPQRLHLSAILRQGEGKAEPVKTRKRLLCPRDGEHGEAEQTGCGCNGTTFPAQTLHAV